MKTINLTQGQVALVDDDMFDYLNQWKWYALKNFNTYYAARNSKREDNRKDEKRVTLLMHHYVIGFPLANLKTDHLDGNGLNNQRDNLKIKTHQQNIQNQQSHRNGRLVGATLRKGYKSKPWQSKTTVNGVQKHIGDFATEQEAHDACMEVLRRKL